MKLGKLVTDLKVKTVNRMQAAKFGKVDYGIVKVAFMVAALDGEVTDEELHAIDALLKKCRGYTAKTAAKVLDEAMHSAGYLMLLGRRVKESAFVKAFLAEAQAALPDGFAFLSVEEVRRAVVTWIALGMSDGDYSARERACIEALRRRFAELKVCLDDDAERQRMALASSFSLVYGVVAREKIEDLFPRNFVTRVERLVAQYGDDADAAKELKALIAAGR